MVRDGKTANALGVWGPEKEEKSQSEFTSKPKQILLEYFGDCSPGLVCIAFLIHVHFSLPKIETLLLSTVLSRKDNIFVMQNLEGD